MPVVHECDDNVSGESEGPVLLGFPQITDLPGVNLLKEQIKTDETLDICRELASKNLNGYMWENDLLFHCISDECGVKLGRLVVPIERRSKVLQLPHDKCSHTGVRGMRKLLNAHGLGCIVTS